MYFRLQRWLSSHLVRLFKKTRAVLLDVMNQDYIRTARALGEGGMEYHLEVCDEELHFFRLLQLLVMDFTGLMGGTLIIEQVFFLNGNRGP